MFYKVNIIAYLKQQNFFFFFRLDYRKSSISVGDWDISNDIKYHVFLICLLQIHLKKKKKKKVVQFLSRLFPASQVLVCVCVWIFTSIVFLPKLTQSCGCKCNKRRGWTGASAEGKARATAQARWVSHPITWHCIYCVGAATVYIMWQPLNKDCC